MPYDEKPAGTPRRPDRSALTGRWAVFADDYPALAGISLAYMLCIAPAVACFGLCAALGAYLFLPLGILLLIPGGPAAIALFDAARNIARGGQKPKLADFPALYRKHWKTGALLAPIIGVLGAAAGIPACFAFAVHAPGRTFFAACAAVDVLLYCCYAPHLMELLIQGGERRGILKTAFLHMLANAGKSLAVGIVRFAWLVICVLFPYFSLGCALLGMPAIQRAIAAHVLFLNRAE